MCGWKEQFYIRNLPRKAILLLENDSSHPNAEKLIDKDIKTMFLPPNVTALSAPRTKVVDQGDIAARKKRYCGKLLSPIVTAID